MFAAAMNWRERAAWRGVYRHWVRDPLVGARLTALHHGMRALPTGAVSAIGGRLGGFAGPRFHPAADARARTALRTLRPELASDPVALDHAVTRMWHAVGRSYAEFSTEDRFWPEGRVSVEGAEHLAAVRAQGKALIVAGVHLGNWELLPIVVGYLGNSVADIYQPQHNRFEDRLAMNTRLRAARLVAAAQPGRGLTFTLLSPSPAVGAELVRALRAGKALMIYVDEHVRGRVQAPSFGRALPSDANLARAVRLARLADAAIVPAYAERVEGGSRFVVRFLPAIPLQRTADRETDLRRNMALLDEAVTAPVLAHLEQWFMLPDLRFDR